MEEIGEYFCWLQGQTQRDAKIVQTDSVKDAAKITIATLRDEGSVDSMQPNLTVFVCDSSGEVHTVYVRQDFYLDESGPRV